MHKALSIAKLKREFSNHNQLPTTQEIWHFQAMIMARYAESI
jgi:hypothetical protein